MQAAVPFACFLSLIRPPGVQFENSLLQVVPVDKSKCPFVRDHTDISFQLFTRHNPTVYEELMIGDDEKLFASSIDLNDQTVIYFHAFMEQPDDGSGIMIREAYMQRGDVNVIMIDARQLEAGPWYFTAAQNTWYIGNFAAQFIDYLVSRGLDLKKTHLVGHSLGAQSAGVAGAALKSGRVSRITGLDPALPLFSGLRQEQRLDSTDADFVDVIHTDAGIFGVKQPVGHVDFYPNGGQSPQPGCELRVIIPEQMILNTCDGHSHKRGYFIYFLHSKTTLETVKSDQVPIEFTTDHNQNDANKIKENKKQCIQDIEETNIPTKYIKNTEVIHEEIETAPNKMVEYTTIFIRNIESPMFTEPRKTIDEQKYQDFTQNVDNDIFISPQKDTIVTEILETFNTNNEIVSQTELFKRFTLLKDEFESHNSITDSSNKNSKQIDEFEIIPQVKFNIHFIIPPVGTFQRNPHKTIPKTNREALKTNDLKEKTSVYGEFKSHVVKRNKRSLSILNSNDNLLFRILNFFTRNRKNILPVLTVMREINTLVRSGNGELNHFIKERNNYIGSIPSLSPITYNLEIGSESGLKTFVKKLLGLGLNGDRLTIKNSRQ